MLNLVNKKFKIHLNPVKQYVAWKYKKTKIPNAELENASTEKLLLTAYKNNLRFVEQ